MTGRLVGKVQSQPLEVDRRPFSLMMGDRRTPLQNRVMPTGEIVSHPARGTMMGNRGCLHGTDRRLREARWRSKLWICCVLSWKGIRRDPMPPGRWTALFFLDEATALAAGHRPCAYCRRADFLSFAEGWRRGDGRAERPRALQIDARLHSERIDPRTRRQITRETRVDELPDGVMIRYRGQPGLWMDGSVFPWSFSGYGSPVRIPAGSTIELLTPPATVAAIVAGYSPGVHPSAMGSEVR
jgi:hypothetical protein